MSKRHNGRTGNRRYRRNRAYVLSKSTVCHICGHDGADTVDHIVPYSQGGTDDVTNLKPAHKMCNSYRGDAPVGMRQGKRQRQTTELGASFTW